VLAAIGPGPITAGGYANAVVALDPKTLQLKDWFTDPTAEFVSAPVVFTHGGKDIVAAATRDGRILLFDAGSLGGSNHGTPLHAARPFATTPATFAPGALSTWQDTLSGTRWLLVPLQGAIAALKVVDDAGRLSLQPGWVSRDLVSPVTPLIVNGVVFALSSGRPAATAGATAADVARRSSPAVLYALNGMDGKELWNSGRTISSFLPGRSFWSATGQVYVGTLDGTLYAFGFAMERK
jgi:outer membrane protein assembly factor BamB